eukprot:1213178-Pyramimonas_sp.AAC.1
MCIRDSALKAPPGKLWQTGATGEEFGASELDKSKPHGTGIRNGKTTDFTLENQTMDDLKTSHMDLEID